MVPILFVFVRRLMDSDSASSGHVRRELCLSRAVVTCSLSCESRSGPAGTSQVRSIYRGLTGRKNIPTATHTHSYTPTDNGTQPASRRSEEEQRNIQRRKALYRTGLQTKPMSIFARDGYLEQGRSRENEARSSHEDRGVEGQPMEHVSAVVVCKGVSPLVGNIARVY